MQKKSVRSLLDAFWSPGGEAKHIGELDSQIPESYKRIEQSIKDFRERVLKAPKILSVDEANRLAESIRSSIRNISDELHVDDIDDLERQLARVFKSRDFFVQGLEQIERVCETSESLQELHDARNLLSKIIFEGIQAKELAQRLSTRIEEALGEPQRKEWEKEIPNHALLLDCGMYYLRFRDIFGTWDERMGSVLLIYPDGQRLELNFNNCGSDGDHVLTIPCEYLRNAEKFYISPV